MKYIKYIPFFIVLLIACKAESQQSSSGTDGVVDVTAFESLLQSDHYLIDVRKPSEYAEGYIADAKNINFYDDDFEERVTALKKDKPILVYCKKGGRSGKTYKLLKSKGYAEVYDLKGGISAWSKASKPIQK